MGVQQFTSTGFNETHRLLPTTERENVSKNKVPGTIGISCGNDIAAEVSCTKNQWEECLNLGKKKGEQSCRSSAEQQRAGWSHKVPAVNVTEQWKLFYGKNTDKT